jgi:hypothetical protein
MKRLMWMIVTLAGVALSAQAPQVPASPRLEQSGLQYVGAFRVPEATSNNDTISFGGGPLAYNSANNSLFIGTRNHNLAEISIPSPAVNSTDPKAMKQAAYLQGLTDPTEGRWGSISDSGLTFGGALVVDGKLIGSGVIYYDANNTQRVSHFSRSLKLAEKSFSGWSSVWRAEQSGYVAGMMSAIPAEWQAALGGNVLTGQCCIPIVSRTSNGPSAFAFDHSKLGQKSVPASALVYYTGDNATLGKWEGSNPTYGAATFVIGMAVIKGTRTLLYFGRNGMGTHCYGDGTADKSLDGKKSPDGTMYCYDPTSNSKGSHAYPYRYQVWAYDLGDLAAVKAGKKKPWQVVPYGVWPITLPIGEGAIPLGGVGYDAEHQLVYLSQLWADKDSGYLPLIHVFKITGGDAPAK